MTGIILSISPQARRLARRLLRLCALPVLFLCPFAAAKACTGPEPGASWTLDYKEYAGENGLPFLSPGNDSRINLLFLMLDASSKSIAAPQSALALNRQLESSGLFALSDLDTVCGRAPQPSGAPPAAADGEGSRCLSLETGKRAFIGAARAEGALTEGERAALIEARSRLTSSCDAKSAQGAALEDPLAPTAKPTPAARDFAAYLIGAKAFYDGDFDEAVTQFASLAKSENAWLRETARYMTARALLNKAQVGAFADFDGTAEPKVSDKSSLAEAESAFKAYLSAYPAGSYADSARGLLRRVYWLARDKAKLGAEYASLLPRVGAARSASAIPDLADEIDRKFLGEKGESRDPYLLAVRDLMRMRMSGREKPVFPAKDLEAQAPDLAGREALYGFLEAARAYYVDGDPAQTLRLLGEPAPGPLSPPYLAFSRETLRGQALMAEGHYDKAAEHWRRLLPLAADPWRKEAVELGLATSWERLGTVNKVFLPETRIDSPRLRAILLRYVAGPILLRMAVDNPDSTPQERRLARFVLLFKEATRGQYANFLQDYTAEGLRKDEAEGGSPAEAWKSTTLLWPGSSAPYGCPALHEVVKELSANPNASHGLLCLGEFMRVADLDGFESVHPAPEELGGTKPIFPGEPFSRGEIYKKLLSEASTPERDKAYALFRLVNCYAPAGNNTCGGKDVELAQRKAWHDELKSRYGATPWAKSLKFYW
jgi:tetratricopeptide (TPR) repeat protein